MKFFAWFFLLPMAIYWTIWMFYHFEPPTDITGAPMDDTFTDKVAFAVVKQAIISIFVGLPLWGWYKWKD